MPGVRADSEMSCTVECNNMSMPLSCGPEHVVALHPPLAYLITSVKRALRLFLLLGALIGLLGQEGAFASAPPVVSASMAMAGTMSGMSEDCMKMMAQQQQPAQKPCKGMTLACIAAMGCTIPMAVRNDAPTLAAREAGPTLAFWSTTTVLRGSDLAPEPEPPTLLG